MEKFKQRVWNKKKYRLGFVLTLVLSSLFMIIGVMGLYNTIFIKTGIYMEKDIVVFSEHDGIPIYLNYYTPSQDKNTNIGVILAHGFSSDRWGFQELTMTLVETGLNVAVFDERGHGDTGGLMKDKVGWEGQYKEERADQANGDLKAMYDFLLSKGCTHIIVIGHSMGGVNAIWFGSEYSDLVDATIAIGAAGPDVDDFLSETKPTNLLIIRGENEELFTTEVGLNTLSHAFNENDGFSAEDLEINTLYGDFAKGTARKLSVISGGRYTGHIQEMTEPLIFIEVLNWIQDVGAARGFQIYYDEDFKNNISKDAQTLQTFNYLVLFGIFIFFIPFVALLGSFAIEIKPTSQKKLEFSFKQKGLKPFSKLLAISFISAWAAVGFAYISNLFSLFYFLHVKYANFLVGTFIGYAIVFYLYVIISLKRDTSLKSFKKDLNLNRERLKSLKNMLIGIIFGFFFGLMNYLVFTSFGLSHFQGSIPLKPASWLIWLIFSTIYILAIIPEEIYLRSFQSQLEERTFIKKFFKITLRNLAVKLPVWMILILVFFIIPPDLMVLYVVGSFVLLGFVEMASVYIYQLTRSVMVSVIFNGISLGWFVMSMLPFVY